jgi:hypothetical protein
MQGESSAEIATPYAVVIAFPQEIFTGTLEACPGEMYPNLSVMN